jgi:hypothetical protein
MTRWPPTSRAGWSARFPVWARRAARARARLSSIWSQTADDLKIGPNRLWVLGLGLTVVAAVLALAGSHAPGYPTSVRHGGAETARRPRSGMAPGFLGEGPALGFGQVRDVSRTLSLAVRVIGG